MGQKILKTLGKYCTLNGWMEKWMDEQMDKVIEPAEMFLCSDVQMFRCSDVPCLRIYPLFSFMLVDGSVYWL